MDERTTGLILRTRLLTETSLIVHWLTPDLGRLSTVAKGARRTKSMFRGKLDLFYLAEFSFQRSRRSDLHNLREVALREMNASLRRELTYLQQSSYCSALIEQTTEIETPLPEVYALMQELLAFLPQQSAQPLTVFAFELKLLHVLGLAPDFTQTTLTPGARLMLDRLAADPWPALPRLKLSSSQTAEISSFLERFLVYHCGKVPRSRTNAVAV